MRNLAEHTLNVEERLRRSVPPIRRADPARVAAALGRIATDSDQPAPFCARQAFARPLIRAAAGLVLLLGLATVLMRPQSHPATAGGADAPQVTTFSDVADLIQRPELALSGEADNLTDDLVVLTDALNANAFAILF